MATGYDLIGDIHGQAEKLENLLGKLGYVISADGYYKHPDRQAVFLADFIDRHPLQKKTLGIVRAMIDNGTARAIQANHEFNAVCYATPDGKGGYIREHNQKNQNQHQAFLNEFPFGSPAYNEQIAWFKTLPVYLDLGGVGVIHACWDDDSLNVIRPYLNADNTLTDAAYLAYADEHKATPFYDAIEVLLKGPEVELPAGITYKDPGGVDRHRARFKWWASDTLPTSDRVESPPGKWTPDQKASIDQMSLTRTFNAPARPVFIGHYWMSGTPKIQTDNVCCVDYSAGRKGPLVAYRWTGENKLDSKNFVW